VQIVSLSRLSWQGESLGCLITNAARSRRAFSPPSMVAFPFQKLRGAMCALVRVHRCLVPYRFGARRRDRAISLTSCAGSQSLNRATISPPLSPPRFVVKKLKTKFWIGRSQPMRIRVKRAERGETSDADGAIRGRESPFADRRCQRLGRDQDKGLSKGRFGQVTIGTQRVRPIAGYLFVVRVNLHFHTEVRLSRFQRGIANSGEPRQCCGAVVGRTEERR
jgi:hypothetical protein